MVTCLGESSVPSTDALIVVRDQLLGWLQDHALPLWDQYGVDRVSGGYFETHAFDPSNRRIEAWGAVRRGRVVARQLYVFDVGHRLGWRSTLSSPVDHGCEYLFSRMHAGDGGFHTSVDATTHEPIPPFSLYEHAFYLFALARISVAAGDRYPVAETAALGLRGLHRDWGKSNGGFDEANPRSLPLKSNPHMHLLEAALAWADATDGAPQQPWVELAQDLVKLCLTHFVDPRTGAVREYFDHQWAPVAGRDGRIVEPGHQFEWAWLLMQWAASRHCGETQRKACRLAAKRLVEVGERWGVDPTRGIAVDEIWDDMSVKESAAKLWPQTERLKAWCAMLELAGSEAEVDMACEKIAVAADGLDCVVAWPSRALKKGLFLG